MSCDHVPVTLLELLSNSLVLQQTVPYLPVSGLLSLGATSRSFQALVYQTSGVFRYLDLSLVRGAGAGVAIAPIDVGGEVWRAERMDEALTEDDFYAGPLRGVFSNLRRKNLLGHVQTLILDGLSVPADLLWDIIGNSDYNVRILSVREVKNLNEKKLMQILRYCVRPSRPKDTPKLKGLYVFGPKERSNSKPVGSAPGGQALGNSGGVMSSEGAQLGMDLNQKSHEALSSAHAAGEDEWYQASGKMISKAFMQDWAETVKACEGLIAFDAVLCRGLSHSIRGPPAHTDESASADPVEPLETNILPPAIATVALGPTGCAMCGTSPEGPVVFDTASQAVLPLLSPPPTHSSTIRAAQRPASATGPPPRLFVRCTSCLVDRWCERCSKFWCESCFNYKKFDPYKTMTKIGAPTDVSAARYTGGKGLEDISKVYLGLCIEDCLVSELMAGAGSGGMWG